MKKAQAQILNPQEEFKSESPTSDYKTAGGVFMTFLKKQIPKDVLKKIYKIEEAKQKEKKEVMKQMTKMLETKEAPAEIS